MLYFLLDICFFNFTNIKTAFFLIPFLTFDDKKTLLIGSIFYEVFVLKTKGLFLLFIIFISFLIPEFKNRKLKNVYQQITFFILLGLEVAFTFIISKQISVNLLGIIITYLLLW